MAVRLATANDLAQLYPLFSRATAPMVHGFPAAPDELCAAFSQTPRHLADSVLLVADAGSAAGRPAGFLRAGLYRPTPDRWTLATSGDGLLFGPFVEPDSAGAIADDLIRGGAAWLRERRARRALAFDPVEAVGAPFFNAGWCGLSERLPGVAQAYARAGFRILHRELCLTRPASPPPDAPEPPRPVSLVAQSRDRNRYSVRLYERGAYIGGCHYSRLHPSRSGRPEAARAGYVDGLAVMDPYQGRGFGRLLLLHALRRLHELGCGPASLTTNGDNYRAQNLYYSLGFALTDSCLTLARPLDFPNPMRRP